MNLETQWVVGFIDGEGCFHIQILKKSDSKTGYEILPEFVVSQHVRSIQVLYALKDFFKTGVVRKESSRQEESGRQYRVRSIKLLQTNIIPFFEKHPLKTTKRIDFLKFRYILQLIDRNEHLTIEGIEKIRKIKNTMNSKKLR
jgi:LAGLIDADG endonuclease